VWTAKLTPPTAAVGSARTKSRYWHGATPPTGATSATGAVGKVLYAQNRKQYVLAVRVARLTPSTTYTVTIKKTSDGPTGPTGAKISHHGWDEATGPTGAPPAIPTVGPITTNDKGFGAAFAKGLRSVAGLEKRATYSVEVTDPAGTVVLVGDLVRNGFKHHRGNCGGNSNPFAGDSRHKHRHHH